MQFDKKNLGLIAGATAALAGLYGPSVARHCDLKAVDGASGKIEQISAEVRGVPVGAGRAFFASVPHTVFTLDTGLQVAVPQSEVGSRQFGQGDSITFKVDFGKALEESRIRISKI